MVLTHFKLTLTASLFHCFFQLKMFNPSVLYFMARQEVQFLMGCLTSYGLKRTIFFIHPSFPFDYPIEWLYVLPLRPSLGLYREWEDYKLAISLLDSQIFHLGWLIHEKILARVGLSLSPPYPTISLGRFRYSTHIGLTLYNVLTWRIYRVCHYIRHYARAFLKVEIEESVVNIAANLPKET